MYNTADQAKARASRALSPEQDPSRYDDSLAAGAVWAKSWIDGRLGSKFEERIPFNPVPDLIQEVAADLAAHFTLKEAFAGGGESKTPNLAQDLFDRAELVLDRLLEGKMALPKPPEETATGPSLGLYGGGTALGPKLGTFYDAHISSISPCGRVLPPRGLF